MRVLLPFLALYRRHWFLISLGMVLATVTLLASISLLTLSGWFLAGAALAGLAGYTFNYMLPAAGVRGSAILRTAGRYAERLVSHDATFRVLAHLRVFAFQKILPLSPGGIARFRQGELLNRLVADVETLDHLYLRVISPILSAFIVIMVLTFGLGFLDLTLAYTLGGIMLALLILLPSVFYNAGKSVGRNLTILRGQYRTQLTAALQGQAELMVFSAVGRFRKSMADIESRWLRCQQQQANLTGLSQAIMIFATGMTVTLILWLAANGVGGNSQPGALIALFVFCSLAAFETLGPVTVAFQHLGQVITSATRVSQLMQQEPEVMFPTSGPESSAQASIDIKNISFTYPDQPMAVLKNVSLCLKAGEHIALLGKTGCGKSTLLQLLTRAWDIDSGSICLNQHAITAYDESTLRSMISVVSQRVHVFSHTLRQNLLLAKPNATDNELETVLKQVGLSNLLETNEGLNCWMGEGGRQLSGGEQRRLGIARALLHSAPLMLLDEPTEGLDADTEQQILSLLRQHCQHKSLIIVTHRLYGLDHMDCIYIMDGGTIIEQGQHNELLAQQGRYYQFYQRQHQIRLEPGQ
ncbi:cysteine/glutathione ABC transporter ATP-binding protein/permease CydC [Photorhabdus laumondii subsp. laumondii]|uniref:Glutathione/L-cysteine transport system ATP-binding/permease protein CydC n=2 Tax=Photorhabdus laumondii subsp. laumondii TaxID=141679 RepID=Q7N6F4_PHOLL|nr:MULTISPECIES: cysteine/glutathione ABC transporter ATP-binding protein/permease CydC [Photorhabdus]AWK41447.1 cysteine/glutathione ABC transporter ATP-binding protein/permease CydC [Photorhabdus laumondii subsp. laumondii]AXG42177.1 cysteine/glutathione ABC transporter ATP-binding protein/permease CydC [Photorhabdus laumondii subsp. laumondii]AXG46769.1 cysteine/glutathione ABC transporter ATP-binding protein/permease CydC [Photorhabdus laumondii subsp. laumondii]MCC8384141.1 cysteine/glutat